MKGFLVSFHLNNIKAELNMFVLRTVQRSCVGVKLKESMSYNVIKLRGIHVNFHQR